MLSNVKYCTILAEKIQLNYFLLNTFYTIHNY